MRVSRLIRSYRKKRGMTQESLASQLNVSAGAVSKWETGASLPDTELLIPLANALQVSLDELFGFSLSLSDEQLQTIKADVIASFEQGSFSDGLLLIERYTAEYPHSEALVYQAAHLIWTYSLLVPFESEEEVLIRREKAFELYEQLFDSDNELMRLNALYSGAVILMTANRLNELEDLLQKIPTADYDTFYMTLHVLEGKEEYLQARELSLKKLFSRTNELCSLLAITGRLYEQTEEPKMATACFELLEKLEELFQLITPSVTGPRRIRKLMEAGDEIQAVAELKKHILILTEQPLNWKEHFLFSSVKLSAGDSEQRQIRKLYVQEMLAEFGDLEGYDTYEEAKKIVAAF